MAKSEEEKAALAKEKAEKAAEKKAALAKEKAEEAKPKDLKVIMRKLNNDGTPMKINGEEVLSPFEPAMADRILKMKGSKWQLVSDPRDTNEKPKSSR